MVDSKRNNFQKVSSYEEKYEPSSIEGWVAEDFIREVSPEELVPNTPPDYFVSAQDTVEQAIEWAESKEGSSEWEGLCLKFVREAFQGELIAGWTSPEAARQQLEQEGKFYTQSNCWNPPRGAFVFFSALEEYQPEGHVGLYLGNGGVVHSYDKVRVDTTENGVNKGIVIVERLPKIGSYIGWAYPPEEWLQKQLLNASFDYSWATFPESPKSGEVITFDASSSEGTIVSYQWDFGDGETATGRYTTHRFRGCPSGLGTYHITLTVEDDIEATATDTKHLIIGPLEKTVEYKQIVVVVVAVANMKVRYNWVDEINGEDVYIISNIHTYSIGFLGIHQVSITKDTYQIWSDVLITKGGYGDEVTYVSPFTPTNEIFGASPPITIKTFPDGTFEGIEVHASDKMNLVVFGATTLSLDGGEASTAFDPAAPVEYPLEPYENMPVGEALMALFNSPGELRVYDSQGRVTGLVNGEVREEIQDSAYFNNTVVILSPSDSYRYEVAGTEDGSYELVLAFVEDGEATTFTAIDISIASGAIHQYTIDWEALSQGEQGVTVQIDNDGDGVFEQTFTTGDTFQLPIASFTYSPAHPVIDETITFNASDSYDPDGNITKYGWNFGDGDITDTTEPLITHSYASAGDYTVNLMVTDDDGATGSTSQLIKVLQPDISVTKIGNVTEGAPSTIVNFTITVNNIGDCTLNPVKVVDKLPAGMSYLFSSPEADTHDGTIIWNNVSKLNPNASTTLYLVAHIDSGAAGILNNTVSTEGKPPHGDNVTDDAYYEITALAPGISVNKIASPAEGEPGTSVIFSINVTNTGDCTLNPVEIEDKLPAGMTYVTSDPPANLHDGTVAWTNVGPLDANESTTITLVAQIDDEATGVLNNSVTATGTPPVGGNVTASDTAPVIVVRLELEKFGTPGTVAPGGTVTYTIKYSNPGGKDLTNVVITDNYPKGMTFISADPAPDAGTNNKWTIGTLPAGASGQIIIKMKVPESRDLSFTESGRVTGEGFVMVSKDLSTEQKPYSLKNVVTLSCAELAPVSASAFTTVSGVPGTSLELTEHGSGIYSSDEILNLQTKNKSIMLQKSTEAEYQPTSFNFSDGFAVNFATRWMQDICAKNMVMGDAMHKKIKDASYIKDETITEVGGYRTSMEFESSFYGAAHIGTVSKSAKTSEDYIGEFEITWAGREECRYLFNWSRVPGNDSEKLIQFLVDVLDLDWAENATITKSVDEMSINITNDGNTATITIDQNKERATVKVGDEIIYVLEVRIEDDTLNIYDCKLEKMEESVTGIGYVMIDKDLASGQMQVREHGSGNYSSDMNFESGRLDKVTEAEYQSTTFNFSDGFDVNFSSNWMQGICSKDKKAATAIHKKISDATSMKDDTTATKSSMEFETSFNGSMHIGARTKGTRISEDYIGVFNITELIKIGKPAISTPSTPTPDWLPCPFPEPGVSTPPSDLHCPSSDP